MFLPKMLFLNLLGCYVSAFGCYVMFLVVVCFWKIGVVTRNYRGNSAQKFGKILQNFWKNTPID